MARILPDTPSRFTSSEVAKVYLALKRLPEEYQIWHNMNFLKQKAPDFLLLRNGRALLVMVSAATARDAKFASQLTLLDVEQVPLGKPQEEVLSSFLSCLDFPTEHRIGSVVVFPHISDDQLKKSGTGSNSPSTGIHWIGRDPLQDEADQGWENLLPETALDELLLEKLRQQFTPEIRIPEEMTVRPLDERRRNAGLTDYLLDYDQEWVVKSDLDLSTEGQSVSSDFRLSIINGVAGSGKTLILLYRLRILHKYFPDKRFLVLTHNKPLNYDLQSRFDRIEGGLPEHIEWDTFLGWCYAHWPKSVKWVNPLSQHKRGKLAHKAWEQHLKESSITSQMFISELDWFKDQIPMKRQEYLAVDRRGRGFGLNTEQRQRIFDALISYQKSLGEGKRDWWDVPQQIWKSLEKGFETPKYDFILIDEAQFFAPIWIQIILRTLASSSSHLFIVADPTQGFLGRGTSWKSLGLDARGRTHLMRHSYRTTREILDFATLLYRQRLANEKDDDILVPDLLNMPSGAFPQVIPLNSPQDEIARVANEVADFVNQGLPRKHLLLLHPDGEGVKRLIQAIEDRLGKGAAMDPKETYPGNYVRVTTLNAGAGLESAIVFLVGVRQIFEEEQSLRLSDSERESLIRDNTRKLYMAATRAGQRLVLTYAGELPEVLNNRSGL